MINPVKWFEIPVNDLDRAKKFYESVFDTTLELHDMPNDVKMAWFHMDDKTFGAAGALMKAGGYTPSHDGTVVYFSIEDINATLEKINANGGKTLLPKLDIGEHGFIAQFEDTEGNRVAIHSMKT